MKGYNYTITKEGVPLHFQFLWEDLPPYLVKDLLPDLTAEANGFSATVAYYPSIDLYVPILKINNYLPEAYVESGAFEHKNLTYVPFSNQLLEYLKANMPSISKELKQNSTEIAVLYPEYKDPLGNVFIGEVDTEVFNETIAETVMETPVSKTEAIEFGQNEVPLSVMHGRKTTEEFTGPDVHAEDFVSGKIVESKEELYDNTERNRPMGVIPSVMPEAEGAEGISYEHQPKGQIPMVFPPTGAGVTVATVEIADVRGLIPNLYPLNNK